MLALFGCPINAQTGSTVEVINAAPINRNYQALREKEDWSFLRNSALRSDFWDPIKFMRIPGKGDDWYTSVGGEAREVWEQIGNDNFGMPPFFNGYLLERYMLHADTHYGPHFRAFVQLKSGLETGRVGGPRPIDEKRLDLLAAFLEVGSGDRDHTASFLRLVIGRQELNYGSGRLVSVREGPTVRQSFDGFRLRSKVGAWNLDGWAVRPDLDRPGFFNNAPNHATEFWGIYSTYLEEFLVESWLEHQRQHERVTVADALLQDRIWALHIGTDHPKVVHFFAEES